MNEEEIKFLTELFVAIKPFLPQIIFGTIFLLLFIKRAPLFAYIFLIFAMMYYFEFSFGNTAQETITLKAIILVLVIIALVSIKNWVHFDNSNNDTHKENQSNKEQNKVNNFYKQIWLKGREGEKVFKDLMVKFEFPYIAVEQSKYTWFKGFKRPDFIIGDNAVSCINKINPPYAFEVKNHSISYDLKYPTYKLKAKEINRLTEFSRSMFMPVYLAFYNDKESCFYFITLQKFLKHSYTKNNLYYIALKRLETIDDRFQFMDFVGKGQNLGNGINIEVERNFDDIINESYG
jgi:hypothetical protein